MAELVPAVEAVADLLIESFTRGGILYTMGNGGSAADAQHLTGELVGRYKRERRPLPAVTLSTDATVMTCIANDYAYEEVFARQVQALARPGDVVAAFTTSGNSPNVVEALAAARSRGAATVLFGGGGAGGGAAAKHADHLLLAPSSETPRIQEIHTLMLHMISDKVDAWAAA
ncbi:SIS domain-containing protein [Nonomuraea mesophila]|uniref:SIS domain-containing protein n=2 Tax=Nonomuraea mesophila TaxID=2530382 RepID=A0A4R5DVG5_9ACTN|nr:SIS domain-containing protein [Nonomuraea mesophila]